MRDFARRALDVATLRGATYADVRIDERRVESIGVKNGVVEALLSEEGQGFGVRVLADGAWGFAASAVLSATEVDRIAALAVEIARASALAKRSDVDLGPPVVSRGSYRTPVEQDPFSIPVDAKVALLLQADAEMRRVAGVSVAEGSLECQRVRKIFASTEGSDVEQELVETGAGIVAMAVGDGEVQTRSFPNSFGRHQGCGGWELVQRMRLVENAPRIAEEAVALLSAPQCPSDVTTVIIDPTQMALQVHESCGHAVELDRVLGMEAAYAGTSFLTPDRIGFQYGSEHVTIVADATVPGGMGTFGWDDEGVPATVTPIVDHGRFVDYLTSRETAARFGKPSNGTVRAQDWSRLPIIRMTNINLLPGPWALDDLIADTDRGLYLSTNRSWSIDDKRLNFQFGTEAAWEIVGGKLGRLYRNATYGGITPEFWRSCDAVCREWQMWGVTNCGKGQPSQAMHVGHGAAASRFRGVRVGIA
ncbi:MAG TPA: TldD/PmbA family protein [Chloroflexota bacterium]|nr:TldD/PmbA family protein [Chloroflexota bacterium]